MTRPLVDIYVAADVARHSREPTGRRDTLIEPGIHGLVSRDEGQPVHLLALDDRGYDRLVAHVRSARGGVVAVFDTASRCEAFVRDQPGWRADRPTTAMVPSDIGTAAVGSTLPNGLALRSVKRLGNEVPDAVPLEEAVALVIASDPGLTELPEAFAELLRGLPSSVQLFAAVDEQRVARATSGCDVFAEYARLFFVNTEPAWRRRGIGRTMTAEALRAAASSGARRGILDSTDAGVSVYSGLGFEVAGRLTRYRRT